PGLLEPRVLVRGVVQHELGDDAQAAAVGFAQEVLEVGERAVRGVDVRVVGDVVAVVPQRRRVEGQEPERGDSEVLQVVELLGQAAEVADAVPRAVGERADVQLVDDRVLVPEGIAAVRRLALAPGHQRAAAASSSRKRRTANGWGSRNRATDGPFPAWTVQASAGIRSNRSSSVRSSPMASRKSAGAPTASRWPRISPLFAPVSLTSTDFSPRP